MITIFAESTELASDLWVMAIAAVVMIFFIVRPGKR